MWGGDEAGGNGYVGTVFLNPTQTDLRLLGGREQAGLGGGCLSGPKRRTPPLRGLHQHSINTNHVTGVRTGGGTRPS